MKFHFGQFDQSEICTEVSFTMPEVMWTVIMKLPHTKVKFYPEVKSQTSLIFTSGLMLTLAKISFANSCTGKWAIPEKKINGLRIYLFKKFAGIFHFFLLYPWKFQTKQLNPWIFHKIVLDPLEIPRTKEKTPWKFHIIFSWSPLEIPLHF